MPDLRFIRVDFLAVPEVLLDEVPPTTSTRRKLLGASTDWEQVALVLHPLDAIERKGIEAPFDDLIKQNVGEYV